MTTFLDPSRSIADRIEDIFFNMGIGLLHATKRALVSILLSIASQYGLDLKLTRDDPDSAVQRAYRRVALKAHPEDPLEASPLCSKVALTNPAATSADSNYLGAVQLKSVIENCKIIYPADISKLEQACAKLTSQTRQKFEEWDCPKSPLQC